MDGHPDDEVTNLLRAWSDGDVRALEKLIPLVYQELHRTAHRYMDREDPDHTLQTTALVNEAYLRLVGVRGVTWQSRSHFLALCAKLMRRILTDFARSRRSLKRGGQVEHVSWDEALVISHEPRADLVALDDALKSLETLDQRKSQVIELRFFGGLSVTETADVLKVSPETVLRDWRLAKDWLIRELSEEHPHGA